MSSPAAEYIWLPTGEAAIAEMLEAIEAAHVSVRLEMYIFHTGPIADKFLKALVGACRRKAKVQVVLDSLGSAYLTDSFWATYRKHGGEIRWFNRLDLRRVFIRDHRKLLVCDEKVAFIGGFNIASEYHGDGIKEGWRDLGMKIRGHLVRDLADAFDQMFNYADFQHKPFSRLRRSSRQKTVIAPDAKLFLSGPGRANPIKRSIMSDLKHARDVSLVTPYFIPPLKMRTQLKRLARQGVPVRLILPGKSDLPVMRMAAQSYYRRFMRAGVQLYEYQPQILHMKLYIIDKVSYAGSANLDARSLNVNYELLVRSTNEEVVAGARMIFEDVLKHSKRLDLRSWRESRTFVDRFKARIAHFVIARLDLFFARRQFKWWKLSLNKVRMEERHKPASPKE